MPAKTIFGIPVADQNLGMSPVRRKSFYRRWLNGNMQSKLIISRVERTLKQFRGVHADASSWPASSDHRSPSIVASCMRCTAGRPM
jgi:hypothetical protein